MPKKLIEAALFMSSRTMSADEIVKITGIKPKSVEKLLEDLRREYAAECKGVEIVRNPEGWEMRVKPDVLPKVAHLTPYSELRDGHKRTLALVVYKEPVKQSHVVEIQGNKAYKYIKTLRKKGLLKAEKSGRTINLTVTKEFERYFGLDRAKIREMLHHGMESAKAREAVKAQKAATAKPLASFIPKAEAKADAKAETIIETKNGAAFDGNAGINAETKVSVKPEARAVQAATPPTNVQDIEVKPSIPASPVNSVRNANQPMQAAPVASETKKASSRKPHKATPAGKIGTQRPASSG